ncbi:MAG: ArnT family glycosyltransferase [Ilumatobacteraceae bacterium]
MTAANPDLLVGRRPSAIVAVSSGVVATVLGVIGIGRSFGYDEAITYANFINGGSVVRALTTQVVFNNHQLFSVVQAIAWRLGVVGESGQRILPVLYGVSTVAVVAWWVTRRRGMVAGLAAGCFLALQPAFLGEFRSLRGYSLAALAIVVAALATHRSWSDDRIRWNVVAGLAMVVAVATHAYSVVALGALAVGTLVGGRNRSRQAATWMAAALVTVLVQLPLLGAMRDNSTARGRRFAPRFPVTAAEAHLGDRWYVAVGFVTLAILGAVTAARSPRGRIAVLAGGMAALSAIVVVWSIVQPYDLYPRFFGGLAPALAVLIGFGTAVAPRHLGPVVVLLLAAMVPGAVDAVRRESPIRAIASVVELARDSGREVCGSQAEALEVYTAPVRPVDGVSPSGRDGYGGCEVFVAVLGLGADARSIAGERFEVRITAGGATVHSDRAFAVVVEEVLEPWR